MEASTHMNMLLAKPCLLLARSLEKHINSREKTRKLSFYISLKLSPKNLVLTAQFKIYVKTL